MYRQSAVKCHVTLCYTRPDTTHECNRQTNGQTDRNTVERGALAYIQCVVRQK